MFCPTSPLGKVMHSFPEAMRGAVVPQTVGRSRSRPTWRLVATGRRRSQTWRLVATGRRRSQTTWRLVATGRRRSQTTWGCWPNVADTRRYIAEHPPTACLLVATSRRRSQTTWRLVATGRRRSQTTWRLVATGRKRSQVGRDQPPAAQITKRYDY